MEDILSFDLEAVAAADEGWGLGYQGRLLAHVAPDLRRFKELTTGQRVIYGRRTLATFPQGQPLPARENVLLTREGSFSHPGLRVVHSLHELGEYLSSAPERRNFVIGGAEVYRQLLPWCARAHITRLHRTFVADCFFPDLDAHPAWRLIEAGAAETWQDIPYSFCTYERLRGGEIG